MGIGKRKSVSDFMPMAKYDATHGSFYQQDRVLTQDGWGNEQHDVTDTMRTKGAIFDLESGQRGWIKLGKGQAPDMVLVPFGADSDPGKPPSPDHSEGVRLVVKFDGDEPREFLSTAFAVWTAIDSVYSAWERQHKDHPGKVPVLKLNGVIKSKSEKSCIPVLVIDRWVPRPADLPAPQKGDPRKPLKPTRTGGIKVASMDEEGPPF
jgi:hypothetical protein